MSQENPREPSNEDKIATRPMSPGQTGESGGGAYPTRGTDNRENDFDGGQSDQAYYGSGQLGDEKVDEKENENAASEKD